MNDNDSNEEQQARENYGQGQRPQPTENQAESAASLKTDKPKTGGNWGKAVFSFLLGVLLTCAVTYFWLGSQNETVATVNGETITEDEFVEAVAAGGGAQVLDQLITEKLIRQKAQEEEISVSDQEYENELATLKEQLPSEEMFEQLLTQQGLTEEAFREQLETNLLIEKLLEPKIEVSDEEVRSHFDENKEQFGQPEQVKMKQIVVETEEEAQKALDRLEDGEDFAEVAQDVSTDTQTKESGGDAGTVSKGDLAQMDPNLEEEVFALEKGEISEPIESMLGGFYIVQVDEKIAAQEGEFTDEVAKQITEELKQQKLQEELPAWLEDLRQDADIDNRLIPEGAAQVMQG